MELKIQIADHFKEGCQAGVFGFRKGRGKSILAQPGANVVHAIGPDDIAEHSGNDARIAILKGDFQVSLGAIQKRHPPAYQN